MKPHASLWLYQRIDAEECHHKPAVPVAFEEPGLVAKRTFSLIFKSVRMTTKRTFCTTQSALSRSPTGPASQ